MDEKELRNGNYIMGYFMDDDEHTDLQSEIVKVIGYDPFNDLILVEGNEGHDDYHEFTDITLDAEWLKQFGFAYDPEGEEYKPFPQYRFFTGRGWIVATVIPRGGVNIEFRGVELKVCSSVHELQNLYFALTGEELRLDTVIKQS